MKEIKQLLSELTLEEKAGLCSALDFWHTKPVERLGIPSVMVSDGPHGLRKQEAEEEHLGQGESIKAVCFPTAAALACSFDRELVHTLGSALGEECQAEHVDTILGPGINIKRSPLCGRNFEYFSEDPFLAGEMGAAYINGVQSQGVGTSLKHYAANNQETRRMSISSQVDERTLRELYLANYETAVKKSQPWTVMGSYNRINGTYSCENEWLLNHMLREEWGFEGIVMTDWSAMNDRVKALKAGLDLEMPRSNGKNDELIVKAVQDGKISMEELDAAVENILQYVKKCVENRKPDVTYSKEAHHALARKIAGECAVLLKNEGILPLKKGTKVAFIGEFAEKPRYQGSGSSRINTHRVADAMQAAQGTADVMYAQGYAAEETSDDNLLAEAVQAAKKAQAAVIFAGLPDSYESEGFDRKHMNLPDNQNELIEAVCAVQPNTVVVLHNGSPVLLPWEGKVKGILEMYLGGEAVGEAAFDVLFGDVNPSGKLAETFPRRLQDTPCYLNFPGTEEEVRYSEGVFVGYRYYDKKEMEPQYPFGYGLSYTTFAYSDLKVSSSAITENETLTVSVRVKNTGSVFGKEAVQLYVRNAQGSENRPEKELKGFAKVALEPGEEKECTFTLDKRSFAYYSTRLHDWFAESGEYGILIGGSSRNIVLETAVMLSSSQQLPFRVTDTTTCGDIFRHAKDAGILDRLIADKCRMLSVSDDDQNGAITTSEALRMMIDEMPLHALISWGDESLTWDDLNKVAEEINSQVVDI